jgi:hypothetical protein
VLICGLKQEVRLELGQPAEGRKHWKLPMHRRLLHCLWRRRLVSLHCLQGNDCKLLMLELHLALEEEALHALLGLVIRSQRRPTLGSLLVCQPCV